MLHTTYVVFFMSLAVAVLTTKHVTHKWLCCCSVDRDAGDIGAVKDSPSRESWHLYKDILTTMHNPSGYSRCVGGGGKDACATQSHAVL
jgi:hypothetical protein